MKKGFAHIFLLIVIVLAGIAGIGYLAYKNGSVHVTYFPSVSATPTPASSVTDTSDWKYYFNEKLEFEFKYPDNWKFKEINFDGGPGEKSVDYEGVHLNPKNSTRGNTAINVFLVKNKSLRTQEYFNINDYSCCGDETLPTLLGDKIISSEKVSVNDLNGWRLMNAPEDIPIEGVSSNWIILENDQKIYLLSYLKDQDEEIVDIESVFSNLLASFRDRPIKKINFSLYMPNNWTSEIKVYEKQETLHIMRNNSDTNLAIKDYQPTEIYIGSCFVYSTACSIGANSSGYRGEFDVLLFGKYLKAETAVSRISTTRDETITQFKVSDNYNYPYVVGRYYSEKERQEILQIISSIQYSN